MARTEAEVQAEIDTINAALQEIISGTRLTRLQVGSGEFAKIYEHQEISYENLKTEKAILEAELDTLTPTSEMTFRTNTSIPLVVTKMPRYR